MHRAFGAGGPRQRRPRNPSIPARSSIATVRGSDAIGLENEKVWNALSRKGLIKCEWPHQIALTPEGVRYDTGIADQILHRGGHH